MDSQRGQIMPLFAIFSVMLFGVMAFALNVALLGNEQSQGQRGTDATALAAAQVLNTGGTQTEATSIADRIAKRNGLPMATLKINYVGNDVQVSDIIATHAPLGSFLGISSDTVTVKSEAASGAAYPVCGICILGTNVNKAINVAGNSDITVASGAIVDNSTSDQALSLTGGGSSISASQIDVVGQSYLGSSTTISPAPSDGASPVTDPLSGIPAPVVSGPIYSTTGGSGSYSLSPGVYPYAVTLDGSGTVTMNPGIYVFEDGLSTSGSVTLNGSGVTMYFTCSGYSTANTEPCNSNSTMATLDAGGSGIFNLSAPTSGNYQGVLVMTDPSNSAPMTINGTANSTMNGTIYAPNQALSVTGTGTGSALNSVIIANSLSVTGTGSLNLAATQQSNAPSTYDGGTPALVNWS